MEIIVAAGALLAVGFGLGYGYRALLSRQRRRRPRHRARKEIDIGRTQESRRLLVEMRANANGT
jgi:hypothetical protein